MNTLTITPKFRPELDPEFLPAALWTRAYEKAVAEHGHGQELRIWLQRENTTELVFKTAVFPDDVHTSLTERYVERCVKFLLWQRGAPTVILEGHPKLARSIGEHYSEGGARAFDWELVGNKLFLKPITFTSDAPTPSQSQTTTSKHLGRHLDGCRIGFDLGGSDRKAAAVIDGKVVFSEEIAWDPYFQSDPNYHFEGIRDSLRRAAANLPRVDAIGGSAAGVYVDNEARGGSLYRGISEQDFDTQVRRLFHRVMEAEGWADRPWEIVNDGEVTALAGSMSLKANAVLGISMGTSLAAGYVDPHGNIKPWLNELAFAPIDYRTDAPTDEWSGDQGCGVQYFSQQAVARLAPHAGIQIPPDMPFPEQLVEVQKLMETDDERAAAIYRTIGTCFGYAIAHYHSYYDFENLLILGRVTTGVGGESILAEARKVLEIEFPELAERTAMHTPNEQDKRHGQAVAAASLPALSK
ncbi:MAG: putative NBD/HSP70 family sugar kinase [Verrucomicrobiales bacterium]|jgi:predicted NBD/HSP70 family sugar kinase